MQFFVNYIVGNIRQWKYKKGVPFLPKMVKKKRTVRGGPRGGAHHYKVLFATFGTLL